MEDRMKYLYVLPLVLLTTTGCGKVLDRLDCTNHHLETLNHQVAQTNMKLDETNAKLAIQEQKLAEVNKRLGGHDVRLATVNTNLEKVQGKQDEGNKDLAKISDNSDKQVKRGADIDMKLMGIDMKVGDNNAKMDKLAMQLGVAFKAMQKSLDEVVAKLPPPPKK